MPARKKTEGVNGSVLGPKLSGSILSSLASRFPGEPLKIIGRYVRTEIDVRIALSKSDTETVRWENARKEFTCIIGMGFDDVLNKKDLNALKKYLKEKTTEHEAVAEVYKSLREKLII
ncbi:MAG: hypothetical protein PHG85_01565 [Candidatus Altiarchaeota archaeon]|nr:hypothetical protein [Candidatus Altiarchaeota archaeon]